MPHIPLPDGLTGMRALLAFRPAVAPAIGALTDVLLHAPHPLTPGERELIAAYVSHLNGCVFCDASHTAIAACHFDADEELIRSIVAHPDTAPVSAKLKALLSIAACVQRSGTAVQPDDVARAREQGATDLEIHDTVLIAALFSMFNRYVDGLDAAGANAAHPDRERARLVARHGYAASLETQK